MELYQGEDRGGRGDRAEGSRRTLAQRGKRRLGREAVIIVVRLGEGDHTLDQIQVVVAPTGVLP